MGGFCLGLRALLLALTLSSNAKWKRRRKRASATWWLSDRHLRVHVRNGEGCVGASVQNKRLQRQPNRTWTHTGGHNQRRSRASRVHPTRRNVRKFQRHQRKVKRSKWGWEREKWGRGHCSGQRQQLAGAGTWSLHTHTRQSATTTGSSALGAGPWYSYNNNGYYRNNDDDVGNTRDAVRQASCQVVVAVEGGGGCWCGDVQTLSGR